MKISFSHPAINRKLCTYLRAKQLQEHIRANKDSYSEELSDEAYNALTSDIDMEEIKNHLLNDSMIVKKDTRKISVKVFPQ